MHSYEDQVADEGEKPGEKEKNHRRAMCGIGCLICAGRGGNFRLEMKLLEEDGGKILDSRKIRFRVRTILALRRLRFYRADM